MEPLPSSEPKSVLIQSELLYLPFTGSRASKAKKKAPVTKAGRKKKKKKGSDDEAFEDSDDGDFEGQEVDYMSDGSR